MRLRYIITKVAIALCAFSGIVNAQSIHFSQYYNAPALLNPANTGLMPDYDYRVGANYRNQWSTLPVPFNTIAGYFDLKVGANRDGEHPNWLGLGGSIFSDKAGNGELSLTQFQGSMAYHLHLSPTSMLSFGGSAAYVQRSVNYDKLTFDQQWDGFEFNGRMPNGEQNSLIKTNFLTIAAGANLAFFPNEGVYIKLGTGIANVNSPVESFYGGSNALGMRPIANLDVSFRAGENVIINPSAYYSTQKGATEIIGGTLARVNLGGDRNEVSNQLILGFYDRLNDAAIGVAGYQHGGLQIMANYDFTMSGLAPYNTAYGAMEFSLVWGGNYSNQNAGVRKMFACPRF